MIDVLIEFYIAYFMNVYLHNSNKNVSKKDYVFFFFSVGQWITVFLVWCDLWFKKVSNF